MLKWLHGLLNIVVGDLFAEALEDFSFGMGCRALAIFELALSIQSNRIGRDSTHL